MNHSNWKQVVTSSSHLSAGVMHELQPNAFLCFWLCSLMDHCSVVLFILGCLQHNLYLGRKPSKKLKRMI